MLTLKQKFDKMCRDIKRQIKKNYLNKDDSIYRVALETYIRNKYLWPNKYMLSYCASVFSLKSTHPDDISSKIVDYSLENLKTKRNK